MGGGTSSGKSPHGPALRKVLRTTENTINKNPYETMVAYDDQGNEIANVSQKNATRVGISAQTGQKLRDAVVTHNHPDDGGTFSTDDVKTAVTLSVQEMRAVDNNGNFFSLRKMYGRKIGTQPPSNYHSFGSAYTRAMNKYNKTVASPQYWNDVNTIGKQAAAKKHWKAIDDFCRDWLRNNAATYGWKYTEGKNK